MVRLVSQSGNWDGCIVWTQRCTADRTDDCCCCYLSACVRTGWTYYPARPSCLYVRRPCVNIADGYRVIMICRTGRQSTWWCWSYVPAGSINADWWLHIHCVLEFCSRPDASCTHTIWVHLPTELHCVLSVTWFLLLLLQLLLCMIMVILIMMIIYMHARGVARNLFGRGINFFGKYKTSILKFNSRSDVISTP